MENLSREVGFYQRYVESLPKIEHTKRLHAQIERMSQLRAYPECRSLEELQKAQAA